MLEAAKNPQALARFKREARVMAKIKNKHAVRIVDVGQLDEDTPYIVMEYLEGRDLSALIKGGPLPIPMACDISLQVCEALASAHAAGVVHRDLKPSNIFLTPQADGSSNVTVIDFGVAKLRSAKDEGKKGRGHPYLHADWLAALHVAGASLRLPRRRSSRGRLGVGGDLSRDAHRAARL